MHVSQLRRYSPRREVDWLPDEENDSDGSCYDGSDQTILTGSAMNVDQIESGEDLGIDLVDTDYDQEEDSVQIKTLPVTTRSGRLSLPPNRFVAGLHR